MVAGGRILFAGASNQAQSWIGSATRVIDMGGGLRLPGFIDSHCHLTSGVCELYEPVDLLALQAWEHSGR